jgi:hypothetical protein
MKVIVSLINIAVKTMVAIPTKWYIFTVIAPIIIIVIRLFSVTIVAFSVITATYSASVGLAKLSASINVAIILLIVTTLLIAEIYIGIYRVRGISLVVVMCWSNWYILLTGARYLLVDVALLKVLYKSRD